MYLSETAVSTLLIGSCCYELEISFPQTIEASLYPKIIKGNGNIMNV